MADYSSGDESDNSLSSRPADDQVENAFKWIGIPKKSMSKTYIKIAYKYLARKYHPDNSSKDKSNKDKDKPDKGAEVFSNAALAKDILEEAYNHNVLGLKKIMDDNETAINKAREKHTDPKKLKKFEENQKENVQETVKKNLQSAHVGHGVSDRRPNKFDFKPKDLDPYEYFKYLSSDNPEALAGKALQKYKGDRFTQLVKSRRPAASATSGPKPITKPRKPTYYPRILQNIGTLMTPRFGFQEENFKNPKNLTYKDSLNGHSLFTNRDPENEVLQIQSESDEPYYIGFICNWGCIPILIKKGNTKEYFAFVPSKKTICAGVVYDPSEWHLSYIVYDKKEFKKRGINFTGTARVTDSIKPSLAFTQSPPPLIGKTSNDPEKDGRWTLDYGVHEWIKSTRTHIFTFVGLKSNVELTALYEHDSPAKSKNILSFGYPGDLVIAVEQTTGSEHVLTVPQHSGQMVACLYDSRKWRVAMIGPSDERYKRFKENGVDTKELEQDDYLYTDEEKKKAKKDADSKRSETGHRSSTAASSSHNPETTLVKKSGHHHSSSSRHAPKTSENTETALVKTSRDLVKKPEKSGNRHKSSSSRHADTGGNTETALVKTSKEVIKKKK